MNFNSLNLDSLLGHIDIVGRGGCAATFGARQLIGHLRPVQVAVTYQLVAQFTILDHLIETHGISQRTGTDMNNQHRCYCAAQYYKHDVKLI